MLTQLEQSYAVTPSRALTAQLDADLDDAEIEEHASSAEVHGANDASGKRVAEVLDDEILAVVRDRYEIAAPAAPAPAAE